MWVTNSLGGRELPEPPVWAQPPGLPGLPSLPRGHIRPDPFLQGRGMHDPQGPHHLRHSVGPRRGTSKAKGQLPHLPGQEGAAPIGQDRLEPPPPRASLSMSSDLRRALSKPPMRCHVCPAGGLWTVQTADHGAATGTQSQPNGNLALNTTSGLWRWEPRLATSPQDAPERGLDGHVPGCTSPVHGLGLPTPG